MRRWLTRRARSAPSAPALTSRVLRSRASRLARSPRAGVSQPEAMAKAESDAATRAVTACRTSRGRSARSVRAFLRPASSPCRSTMRSRLPVVMRALRLRTRVVSEGTPPISAMAPATAWERPSRPAMAVRVVSQPTAMPSTRSASVRTEERRSTRAAMSGWSPAKATTSERGAVAQPAQACARARRTARAGSSRSARIADCASRAAPASSPP